MTENDCVTVTSSLEARDLSSEICIQISDRKVRARIFARGFLQAKRIDDSRKRRWLLLPTRIVEEESREGRTPMLEHAHQCSAREVLLDAILRNPGQAGTVEIHFSDDARVFQANPAGRLPKSCAKPRNAVD